MNSASKSIEQIVTLAPVIPVLVLDVESLRVHELAP